MMHHGILSNRNVMERSRSEGDKKIRFSYRISIATQPSFCATYPRWRKKAFSISSRSVKSLGILFLRSFPFVLSAFSTSSCSLILPRALLLSSSSSLSLSFLSLHTLSVLLSSLLFSSLPVFRSFSAKL